MYDSEFLLSLQHRSKEKMNKESMPKSRAKIKSSTVVIWHKAKDLYSLQLVLQSQKCIGALLYEWNTLFDVWLFVQKINMSFQTISPTTSHG